MGDLKDPRQRAYRDLVRDSKDSFVGVCGMQGDPPRFVIDGTITLGEEQPEHVRVIQRTWEGVFTHPPRHNGVTLPPAAWPDDPALEWNERPTDSLGGPFVMHGHEQDGECSAWLDNRASSHLVHVYSAAALDALIRGVIAHGGARWTTPEQWFDLSFRDFSSRVSWTHNLASGARVAHGDSIETWRRGTVAVALPPIATVEWDDGTISTVNTRELHVIGCDD